jgi:hypothetical protein
VVYCREVRLGEGEKYRAARTMQRWFRGHVTRLRLSEKARAATAIQAWWRSRQVRLKHMEETQVIIIYLFSLGKQS